MHYPAGNENEGTLGSIDPLLVDQHAHRSFDDVPGVVLIVGVCIRPLGIRLQPPFGDGIGASCFSVICLENCSYATHGIGAAAAGGKKNGFASPWSRFAHTPSMRDRSLGVLEKGQRVRSDAVEAVTRAAAGSRPTPGPGVGARTSVQLQRLPAVAPAGTRRSAGSFRPGAARSMHARASVWTAFGSVDARRSP